MSDLDKKLGEALGVITEDGQFISAREFLIQITEHFDPEHAENPMQARTDKAIEQIKQAFIDAGWLSPEGCRDVQEKLSTHTQLHVVVTKYLMAGGDHDFVIMSRTDWTRNAKQAGFMTGQEWVDKFDKELRNLEGESIAITSGYRSVMAAAKKAAGIE